MRASSLGLAAALAIAAGLGACEHQTPYQPLQKGTAVSGGFSDQRLDDNHSRVTFQGNTVTSRETVETYLLYRAAEVTVDRGFDWFEPQERHTERDRRTYVDSFYGPGYPYGFWRPRWRFWAGYGWGGWGPYWGDPVTIQTVQKFEATAEISMGHGPKPDARAFNAREVMANLGAKIQRPTS
jgi:hypothetical protein